MARAETIVIDASVAVKWFNKEEYSDDADRLKEAHVRGRIRLAAPELLLYEVLNALRYNPELGESDVQVAAKTLIDIQILLPPPGYEWLKTATSICYKHGVTFYDAAYLALAKYLNTKLFTADQKFIEKVKDPDVIHIKIQL